MTRTFDTIETLIDHVLDLQYFHENDDGQVPIPVLRDGGVGRFAVVLGENASGKSFFRRCVTAVAHEGGAEPIPISMEGRGLSYGGIGGLIYGDEAWQSTGQNSVGTVLGGITTCRNREKPHVMFWDEPDLGLSDSWAAGMGIALREFAEDLPKHTKAVFLVTHSRALVRELLPVKPHYLYLGDAAGPRTFVEWLNRPIEPRPIETLHEESMRRFRMIRKILDRVKGKRD